MICLFLGALGIASPSLASRVLVVVNADSDVSREVGAYYMSHRGVRSKVEVHCADSAVSAAGETIAYPAFEKSIEQPVELYLAKHSGIDFIVLTKGVPIRITGAPDLGMNESQPSVDSFLASLGYGKANSATKVTLTDSGFKGAAWLNRFWGSEDRFSHSKFGGYLVTRLDGYTAEDAERLVDESIEAEQKKPDGKFLLDSCPSFGYTDPNSEPMNAVSTGSGGAVSVNEIAYNHYNGDMLRAASELEKRGALTEMEKTDTFVSGFDLMGYVSWGSNDSHFDASHYHALSFAPGGIAETAVSTSARTFLPTGGGQSLIADLIAQGATGTKGYCDEPLLQAVASPTILFDRYTRGWTLAESYYAASRFVGWEDIVVGDPICQPFGR